MDIALHYIEQGAGEPLVLLHGNGEDGSYFAAQTEYFSKDYRVIAPDTRGHGRTPRGSAPFTLEQFAQDLREFLDGLCLTQINLLGFSDGGNIALLFALRYPAYVKKLILNGANLSPAGVKTSVQTPMNIAYAFASLAARLSSKALAGKEQLGLMVTQPNIPKEDISAIRCPTLVLAGSEDMIKQSHSELIASYITTSRLKILEGDHFIASKKPGAFNAAVEEFLRSPW